MRLITALYHHFITPGIRSDRFASPAQIQYLRGEFGVDVSRIKIIFTDIDNDGAGRIGGRTPGKYFNWQPKFILIDTGHYPEGADRLDLRWPDVSQACKKTITHEWIHIMSNHSDRDAFRAEHNNPEELEKFNALADNVSNRLDEIWIH